MGLFVVTAINDFTKVTGTEIRISERFNLYAEQVFGGIYRKQGMEGRIET